MKSITIKKLYRLHSWVGIITGILLFVIAFTGAVAVFARPELKIWANENIRTPVAVTPQTYQKVIDKYAEKVGPDYLEEIHFQLPSARTSAYARLIYEGHFEKPDGSEEHKGIVLELDPRTFELKSETDMTSYFANTKYDMANFLAGFHADLHLGRPVGLILTGLLGLTLMVSIVTGLFIHRKILTQLFTFRPQRSFTLMLNDGHKVMSVWGVMFHSVIAFTGAFLGLATVILVPAAAYVGFNGDQEKLVETFTAIKAPVLAHVERPTKIADILQHSIDKHSDLVLSDFSVLGYQDENAMVYVKGSGNEQLGGQTLVYQGATGEFIRHQANFGRLEGVTGKILDAMFPLHFGNFGGVLVKSIWAILGLATALLPITGLMLWIERGLNAANPAHSRKTYEGMNRLLIGSCGGVVLATAALFPAQLFLNKLYPGGDHTSPVFYLFFSIWLIACVYGLIANKNISARVLAIASAICLLITMPLDAMFTNSHLFNMIENQHFVSIGVNLVTFILGGLLLFVTHKLKVSKQESQSMANEVITQESTA